MANVNYGDSSSVLTTKGHRSPLDGGGQDVTAWCWRSAAVYLSLFVFVSSKKRQAEATKTWLTKKIDIFVRCWMVCKLHAGHEPNDFSALLCPARTYERVHTVTSIKTEGTPVCVPVMLDVLSSPGPLQMGPRNRYLPPPRQRMKNIRQWKSKKVNQQENKDGSDQLTRASLRLVVVMVVAGRGGGGCHLGCI